MCTISLTITANKPRYSTTLTNPDALLGFGAWCSSSSYGMVCGTLGSGTECALGAPTTALLVSSTKLSVSSSRGTKFMSTNFSNGVSHADSRCTTMLASTSVCARRCRRSCVAAKAARICAVLGLLPLEFFFRSSERLSAKAAAVSIALLPPCPDRGLNCSTVQQQSRRTYEITACLPCELNRR